MKKLIVPALALGLAMAFAQTASAEGLNLFHKSCCEPCKPACPKPECKPCCPKPVCCKPACPKPCDPCDSCGIHRLSSRLKGMAHGFCHKDRGCNTCNTCGDTIMEGNHEEHKAAFESTPGPRLTPVPTTMRSTRRSSEY